MPLHSCRYNHAELLAMLRDLQTQVKISETENAQLKAENSKLREDLRASKRPTAPFSKGKDKAHPKRPGRKAGKGIFTNRPEPQPTPSDIVEDIEVPLDWVNCPQCGVEIEIKKETSTVEDTETDGNSRWRAR